MEHWIRLSVPFVVDGPSIDDHAFVVLDGLFELTEHSQIRDPDVYVDVGKRAVTLELLAGGPSELDAVRSGLAAMRTAIHAAGGTTHNWEDDFADLTNVEMFPTETPRAEWERTETTYSKVLMDA